MCGAAQASGQYYDFGKVGGQNTRCVGGAPTPPDQDHCVKRDGQLYFAGTTLPKADGWQDCDQGESQIVALAPNCRDL